MSEIDSTQLRCNSCWVVLGVGQPDAYKTTCSHLFCGPCTTRSLSKSGPHSLCPLCDQPAEDLLLLTSDRSTETAVRFFSFAAFYPEDALRLVTDAAVFARSQTGLYGTREVWMKQQEVEGLKRRLTEADNRVNSLAVRGWLGALPSSCAQGSPARPHPHPHLHPTPPSLPPSPPSPERAGHAPARGAGPE